MEEELVYIVVVKSVLLSRLPWEYGQSDKISPIDVLDKHIDTVISHIEDVIFNIDMGIFWSSSISILSSCHHVCERYERFQPMSYVLPRNALSAQLWTPTHAMREGH